MYRLLPAFAGGLISSELWHTPVDARNSCAGSTQSPLASLEWFSALRIETSLQRLWCSIMRLLASNRVRGEVWRTREASRLRWQLPTHATRALPYARPAPLIQVSFLLLRFGGWCPPGGTPNVAKALSIVSSLNPASCNMVLPVL